MNDYDSDKMETSETSWERLDRLAHERVEMDEAEFLSACHSAPDVSMEALSSYLEDRLDPHEQALVLKQLAQSEFLLDQAVTLADALALCRKAAPPVRRQGEILDWTCFPALRLSAASRVEFAPVSIVCRVILM